jgi:hypothetical protein
LEGIRGVNDNPVTILPVDHDNIVAGYVPNNRQWAGLPRSGQHAATRLAGR